MYCADAIIDFIDGLIFKATLDIIENFSENQFLGILAKKTFDQREPVEVFEPVQREILNCYLNCYPNCPYLTKWTFRTRKKSNLLMIRQGTFRNQKKIRTQLSNNFKQCGVVVLCSTSVNFVRTRK